MTRAITSSAVAVLLLAVAASGCGGSAATPSPSPAEPSPSPSGIVTPSPTPSPSPSSDPSSGSPQPTSAAPSARLAMQEYAEALLGGRYEDAWLVLGPGCQSRWGSLSAFTKERSARMKLAGAEYELRINPQTLPLGQWLIGASWAGEIDQSAAFLFSLRWLGFGDDARGTEIWIADPAPVGWNLYLAN